MSARREPPKWLLLLLLVFTVAVTLPLALMTIGMLTGGAMMGSGMMGMHWSGTLGMSIVLGLALVLIWLLMRALRWRTGSARRD